MTTLIKNSNLALQKGINYEEISRLVSFLKNSIGEIVTSTAEQVAKNIDSEGA